MQNKDHAFDISTGGSPWISTPGSTGASQFVGSNVSTNQEIENRFRHMETRISGVEATMRVLEAEIKSEVRDLLASIRETEANRKAEQALLTAQIEKLTTNLEGAKTTLPTKETVRNWVLTGVGLLVALLAMLWQVFGVGGDMAGNFADRVLETERKQDQIIDMLQGGGSNEPEASDPTG